MGSISNAPEGVEQEPVPLTIKETDIPTETTQAGEGGETEIEGFKEESSEKNTPPAIISQEAAAQDHIPVEDPLGVDVSTPLVQPTTVPIAESVEDHEEVRGMESTNDSIPVDVAEEESRPNIVVDSPPRKNKLASPPPLPLRPRVDSLPTNQPTEGEKALPDPLSVPREMDESAGIAAPIHPPSSPSFLTSAADTISWVAQSLLGPGKIDDSATSNDVPPPLPARRPLPEPEAPVAHLQPLPGHETPVAHLQAPEERSGPMEGRDVRRVKSGEEVHPRKVAEEESEGSSLSRRKSLLTSKVGSAFRRLSAGIHRSRSPDPSATDREELMGKAATHTPGYVAPPSPAHTPTAGALSEASRRLDERSERLHDIQDKSERLAHGSSNFASLAQQLAEQEKNRKWWQL